jgi:nitrite reductase/ring-hydroxylating ferredoxin subunit
MATDTANLTSAGSLADLERQRCVVVTGAVHIIAVFHHGERVYALDNRCPRIGFPLSQGTTRDDVLTCHWHHTRFLAAHAPTVRSAGQTYRTGLRLERGDQIFQED